jgi:competence protein ComEA
MSDDPLDLVRPEPPRSWRDHASAFAESLDLSPRRLAVALVALALAGLVAWRLLAPAEPAAEMELPFADPASSGGGGAADAGGGSGGSGGAGGPGGPGAAAAQPAGSPAPGASGVAAAPAGSGSATGSTVPAEVVVHVAGAVGAPGVQRLPGGSRVVDAVEAAGGANPDADLGRINLAVPVQDGQQVYVPRVGEVPPTPVGGAGGPSVGSGGSSGSSGGVPGSAAAGQPVNVNTASADELDTLPGVGPATAEAIISHREQNGPFTSVDQLLDVRGIGDAKLEQLRDLVVV